MATQDRNTERGRGRSTEDRSVTANLPTVHKSVTLKTDSQETA